MNFKKLILYAFIILLPAVFFLNGCKDSDPVTPPEEHFEAIGIVLYQSGIQVLSILRGQTSDTLFAQVDSLSSGYDVKFYDENENIINPPDDEDITFGWTIDNPSLVEVYQHPGEEGGYEFHLRGLAAGTTKIEFMLVHGGHADFRSGKITVAVE